MKANEVKLERFLSTTDTKFIIPVYQRNYDWTKNQCKQLIDDILEVGCNEKQNSHFIGSIVYIHDDVYSSAGTKELTIIDGQQRLVTITLIYIIILAIAKRKGNEQLVNKLYETYIINKYSNDEEKLKLRPTENNDSALKYLIRKDFNDKYREYNRLIDNYEYLETRINEENYNAVLNGINKLIFVEVSLERGKDDPQKIFESLNSTGLELSQADLIRNYILMGLKPNDQIKMYNNYWKHIELNATQKDSNINLVSDFIRDYLTIKKREIPKKSEVYQEFKNEYKVNDINKLENELSRLKKFSSYYNKFINPSNESDKEISKQINLINKLEINVSYPFLLEIFDDYENKKIDKKTLLDILELVQSFVWRRFIISLPTNALNKIFMRLYEDIDESNYLQSIQKALIKKKGTQKFPKDQEVVISLKEKDMYNIQPKNRNYFFERIENHNNLEPVMIENNPDITIEHIFPQTPNAKWKITLKDEEFNFIKDNYLNTIANLTLSGNNGKLSNEYFIEKQNMNKDGKEQGYKYSRLWLNRHLSTLTKWDKEEIENRAKLLGERFLEIWQYPKLQEIDITEDQEINIFDAEDPTGKKLDYIIFFDQKIEVKNITIMYCQVFKQLFELQPSTFFNTDLGEKIEITTNKLDRKAPGQLNESYYVETNLSSKEKFERIKYALQIFGITDELYIKYAEKEKHPELFNN